MRRILLAYLGLLVVGLLASAFVSAIHEGISVSNPSGSTDVSNDNIIRSYDWQTLTPAGTIKDFSLAQKNLSQGTGFTVGADASAPFGLGTYFDGTGSAGTGIVPLTIGGCANGVSCTDPWSMFMWFKPVNTGGERVIWVTQASNFLSYGKTGANLRIILNTFTGPPVDILIPVSEKVWHSFGLTMYYANGTLIYSLDGQSVAVTGTGTGTVGWTDWILGCYQGGILCYKGSLDEMTFWARALSNREMQVLSESMNSSTVTGSATNALPSMDLLVLGLLGSLWLAGALAGTILRTGFFVILGGISALAFAITAWTTTGELFSSTLLFAAAVLTLAWVPFMADRERTPE